MWSKLESTTAKPYGLGEKKKDADYKYVTKLFNVLLIELSDMLNSYLNSNHSVRYWQILLGHWLHRVIYIIFNRWHTLQQAIHNYNITKTISLKANDYSLVTQDSLSLIWACNDDVWNHVLYAKILSYMGDLKIEFLEGPKIEHFGFTMQDNKKKENYFDGFLISAAKCMQLFCRDSDAFIINSYLSRKDEFKLQLSLLQIPQFWQSPKLIPSEVGKTSRKGLSLNCKKHQGFERCIRALLIEMLPTCYLEGRRSLINQVNLLKWPKSPKFIFTSNNFDTDEIFKAWVGRRIEEGTEYFTGQHGNDYGTLKYCSSESELVATSDKFITWGWSDKRTNVIPAFNFKSVSRKPGEYDQSGGLLLIELCVRHRENPWDDYYEYGQFQSEQFQFIETLPLIIQKEVTVRLHSSYVKHKWSDMERWNSRFPELNIDNGSVNIQKVIARSRIVVHSYDSTGILETLTLNIPTVCFWRNGLEHLVPSARPYYELLKEVGILTDSPEQAAKLVIQKWDNVGEWWNSSKVQNARNKFCNKYSRVKKSPVRTLKNILTQKCH